MTIPSSGPVSFADIQTEYGGSNPIGLNEYYNGATPDLIWDAATNSGIPSSGPISLNDFRGTTQGPDIVVTTGTTTFRGDGIREGAGASSNPTLRVKTKITVTSSSSLITVTNSRTFTEGGSGTTTDQSTAASATAVSIESRGNSHNRWKLVATGGNGPVGDAGIEAGGTILDNTFYPVGTTRDITIYADAQCTLSGSVEEKTSSVEYTFNVVYDTTGSGAGTVATSVTISANSYVFEI